MKIEQLIENIQRPVSPDTVYYHGTNANFNGFSLDVERQQSNLTVLGVYFTPYEQEARQFGRNVISANLFVQNPFYNLGRNRITNQMTDKYKEILLRFTNQKEYWIDTVLIPEFIEKQTFTHSMQDLNGAWKREILLSGGYDAYIDGTHVVILEPSQRNIKILDGDI